MMTVVRLTCSGMLLLALHAHAEAATYYVDATTGSNANSCLAAQNPATPKATPFTASGGGQSCLAAGDTLVVGAGTYAGEFTNPVSGTPAAYTTIKAAVGARPRIIQASVPYGRGVYCDVTASYSCSYIEINGFEFAGVYDGVKLATAAGVYAHHIRLLNNWIHDTTSTGWYAETSPTGFVGGDHLIRGNVFYNIGIKTPHYVPGMNAIYNPGSRTVVEDNEFHDCTDGVAIWKSGIKLESVIVRGNVFHDMARLDVDTWMQGTTGGAAISVNVGGTTATTEHQIYNNVIYRSGYPASFVVPAPYCNTCSPTGASWNPPFTAIREAVFDGSTPYALVANNTIADLFHSGSNPIWAQTTNVAITNNIAYPPRSGIYGGTQSGTNLTADPSFVSAATGDFHLRVGSVAIDRGMTVSQVQTDIAGTPRPQNGVYDIGAYEGSADSSGVPAAPQGLVVR